MGNNPQLLGPNCFANQFDSSRLNIYIIFHLQKCILFCFSARDMAPFCFTRLFFLEEEKMFSEMLDVMIKTLVFELWERSPTHSIIKNFSSWYSIWPSSGIVSVRRIFLVSRTCSTMDREVRNCGQWYW